ncbi:leucine-rich repeat serine/threonine-protein kinase 1-like isoform X1 [Acipenser oxyrinchus oxyrinchus]|uniref:non-specific serine/threonine protein kinase n=1 Tax=Acipenser oxyrinchus oxyrinchus TaxID=40147 RepID=A0AAD8D069_ACIOX|nr:leucine-rich repeat serine/threonine-protein kinase 1-like isoform X1 [Acipenser oxyrinchus oxyrinchus]
MYWSVGMSESTDGTENNMDGQHGTVDMGGKQSILDNSTLNQSPTIENIQAAYKEGDTSRAQELIKISVGENNRLRLEKHQLLGVAAGNGDLEAVQYLLKEGRVDLPREPTDENPAVVAAYYGHEDIVKELLDSLPGSGINKDLLNWMLAKACQQGHVDIVKLLVLNYKADTENCAIRSNDFAVITGVPLYAAAKAGNEEIAAFLLQNGSVFCSYTLMDHPHFAKQLLRARFVEPSTPEHSEELSDTLSVQWSRLKLPWLELDWFIDLSSRISQLDLSSNSLTGLPSVIPWGLIHLRQLNLADNQLRELPSVHSSEGILCTRLLEVSLSQNELTSLSSGFLHLSNLQKLLAAKNQLTTLFEAENGTNWIGLRRLQELDVSDNRLTEVPACFLHCFKSLRSFNVSRNKLKVFPDPWACPLQYCRASSNSMESIPDTISIFWRNHLKEIDFSDNCLKELPLHMFQLEALVSLKVSENQLSALPSPNKWTCSQLKSLDLSKNQLGKTEEGTKTKRLSFFTTWSRRDPHTASLIEFPGFLSECLEVLFLNDNQLEAVPQSVCCLKSLNELYLSHNPGIRELPPELGQLSNLWQLDIEELNIGNIPAEVRKEGPSAVLAFLRAHLRKAEKSKLLKMIVVGPPRQGKSALLEALQTGKVPQMMQNETSIRTTKWELEKPNGVKAKMDSVEFNVWVIGGPASMSTVNQCFFTDKALYVVIWNLALGEEAVANLQSWLLNIEARAPNAAVVVVGTHLDLIDSKFRTERIATLRAYVLSVCRSPSGTRATGYPDITCKHLHEVSCKTLEGFDGLRRLLFQVSCNIKDMSNAATSQKLVGRLIPKSYLLLQEAVLAERLRRDLEDEVQYLTDLQLEQIIEQNPDSDIKDYEDLQTALSFLIETGALLHFPDTSHGLRNLYFLDAVWLSECLERIINIKSSKSVAKNGVIKAEDLRMLLVGTGFTEETEEQYFQFLAKFEIALPVASDSYLLPHLLPPKPGLDIHGFRQQTANTIQRLFKMSFVPAGFWQRFIARMLISLTEMDLQSFETKRNTKSLRNRQTIIYSFAGNQQRNRCSTFRVRRSQTIYWKEGLLVTFDGGYLSVESSDLNWKKKKSGGIKIICQSENRDFSAMAFITDHVNSLIDQWFPALTASENDGTLLIEQYAPCPCCATATAERAGVPGTSKTVHYFNMEDCVHAAMELDHIVCPNHPSVPVPLQELVPELFMTDLPARLFLEKSSLEYSEDESNILGQGGSGTIIFKAQYKNTPVAVKRFKFKRCRQQSLDASTDTMVRHLRSMDALRNFSEFRQEASMLHSLQHPCIVSLIGISIHPLCFALQLAPLGSLNTVLEEHSKGVLFMPLGPMLTFKAAYQIAAGLAYLHRKNIIFCDLKSDNILVWSLETDDPVNIKLSDYGISRQSFHEGALGVEGTPGYQAPEIRPGIVYDEKVDMFSYGMVLFELLSGRRPVLGQHQLQIVKKLSKGIRPVLGLPEEVQFHCLQTLMLQCWDTKPEKRPVALSLLKQMQEPSFPSFMYLLPSERHSQLFLPTEQEHTAVFWDGENEERNYTVVNIEKGLVEVQRMACGGMKLSCQLKIENTLWTATEDHHIYIYTLKGMCPLSTPQKCLPCPAVVTCMLAVPAQKKTLPLVFVGMADGLVAVYTLINDLPDESQSYLCSHTLNKSVFKISDDDPRQNPYPVKVMVLVKSGSEIWYSTGPGILIIDCLTLQSVKRLDPYVYPSTIISMTCNSGCGGEEAVWCLDDKTNTLLMYHAATYQLCARYFCGDSNPLRDMFTVQKPAGVIREPDSTLTSSTSPSIDEKGSKTNSPGDVTIIYNEETGTQIIRHQDSLTDYCSMSSCSSDRLSQIDRSSSGILNSLASSTSIPFSTDCEESDRWQDQMGMPVPESMDSSPQGDAVEGLQAVKVLAVKDTLWIPRRGGDVIVIELEKGSGTRGRVFAVLKEAALAQRGVLVEAAVVAKDTVVCGFQNENMEWCLAVWRGWGAREFEIFYQSYEELGKLEIGMRKRR